MDPNIKKAADKITEWYFAHGEDSQKVLNGATLGQLVNQIEKAGLEEVRILRGGLDQLPIAEG